MPQVAICRVGPLFHELLNDVPYSFQTCIISLICIILIFDHLGAPQQVRKTVLTQDLLKKTKTEWHSVECIPPPRLNSPL